MPLPEPPARPGPTTPPCESPRLAADCGLRTCEQTLTPACGTSSPATTATQAAVSPQLTPLQADILILRRGQWGNSECYPLPLPHRLHPVLVAEEPHLHSFTCAWAFPPPLLPPVPGDPPPPLLPPLPEHSLPHPTTSTCAQALPPPPHSFRLCPGTPSPTLTLPTTPSLPH